MQTQRCTPTLVLAFLALALAGYAIVENRPDTSASDWRLDRLEARLDHLEAIPEVHVSPNELGPHLRGRSAEEPRVKRTEALDAIQADPRGAVAANEVRTTPRKSPEDAERIEELVEASVAKKAAQLQVMSNKKPSIDLFATTLGLTDAQRFDVEQEVIHGQQQLRDLLGTPTADGSVLLDDLVEALAHSLVDPDQARTKWGTFLGRVLSEEIPGTEETYGLRAETLKGGVREGLRRTLSDEQFAAFMAWRLDPTEIQGIQGSPWKGIEPRVQDRAEALRAEREDVE